MCVYVYVYMRVCVYVYIYICVYVSAFLTGPAGAVSHNSNQ